MILYSTTPTILRKNILNFQLVCGIYAFFFIQLFLLSLVLKESFGFRNFFFFGSARDHLVAKPILEKEKEIKLFQNHNNNC